MPELSIQERQRLNETYGLAPGGGRDNRLLGQAMRVLRRQRVPLPPEDAFSLFRTEDHVQLWIQTEACRHSKAGSCTVCNYWRGRRRPGAVEELIARDALPRDAHTLLLNTCGSCLDPRELRPEEQDRLLAWLARQPFKRFILETHADTLDPETVQRACRSLGGREVFFEFGIESTSADTLFYCLNKRPPKKSVPEIAETVRRCGALCIANVLLGAPFLTREEQAGDAAESIRALLEQGADYITLFPVNIKACTLPDFLYRNRMYGAVTGDMIAEVLSQVPPGALPRVDVAWYGEHREAGTVPPRFCPKCQGELPGLLGEYDHTESAPARERLVTKMRSLRCTCPPEDGEAASFFSRLDRGYGLIQESLLKDEVEYRGSEA